MEKEKSKYTRKEERMDVLAVPPMTQVGPLAGAFYPPEAEFLAMPILILYPLKLDLKPLPVGQTYHIS